MSVIDFVIIAAVVVATVLCLRYMMRHNEDCADCTHADACSAANRAAGRCVAADDMMARVDAAFAANEVGGTSNKAQK